jgi:hypothetical protein
MNGGLATGDQVGALLPVMGVIFVSYRRQPVIGTVCDRLIIDDQRFLMYSARDYNYGAGVFHQLFPKDRGAPGCAFLLAIELVIGENRYRYAPSDRVIDKGIDSAPPDSPDGELGRNDNNPVLCSPERVYQAILMIRMSEKPANFQILVRIIGRSRSFFNDLPNNLCATLVDNGHHLFNRPGPAICTNSRCFSVARIPVSEMPFERSAVKD